MSRFGAIVMLSKRLRADLGGNVDAYLAREFDALMPLGSQRTSAPQVTWIDGDEDIIGRDIYVAEGMEPPRDFWLARMEADVDLAAVGLSEEHPQ